MDKYEYKLRLEEIKTLNKKGRFQEAAQVADSVDWNKVRNVSTLCVISDVYKINRRFEDAKAMLLLANEKSPNNRRISYALCDLTIKMGQVVEAVEYYKEFVQQAPNDNNRYILLYKIYEAQDISLEERIAVLKEYKKREYNEKWAYELAFLYHRVGLATECIEECDQLILWFGEGKYVIKAMELKQLYTALSPAQQQSYDFMTGRRSEPEAAEEQPEMEEAKEVEEAAPIEEIEQQSEAAADQPQAENVQTSEEMDIHVKPMDMGEYNTINLQAALAESMREVLEPESMSQEAVRLPDAGMRQIYAQEKAAEQLEEYGGENVEYLEDVTRVIAGSEELTNGVTGQLEEEETERVLQQVARNAAANVTQAEVQVTDAEAEEQDSPAWEASSEEISAEQDKASEAEEPLTEKVLTVADVLKAAEDPNVSLSFDSGMDNLLSQEYDGQISLALPEERVVEKQITGQMNIEDVLREWERMKDENARKRKEETREWMMQQTGSLFAEFDQQSRDGVLEQLEREAAMYEKRVNAAQKPAAAKAAKQEYIEGEDTEVEELEEIEELQDDSWTHESGMKAASSAAVDLEADVAQEAPRPANAAARAVMAANGMVASAVGGDTAEAQAKSAEEVDSKEQELAEEQSTAPVLAKEQKPDAEDTAEGKKAAEIEKSAETEKAAETENASEAEKAAETGKTAETESAAESAEEAEEAEDPAAGKNEAVQAEDADKETEAKQENGRNHEDTAALHARIKEQQIQEHMRHMGREEKEMFAPYVPTRGAMRQLVGALDSISLSAFTGNVILTGAPGSDTMGLARNMIRSIRSSNNNFSGKIAKISGDILNEKNAAEVISKIAGGALIVEKAGKLSAAGAANLASALNQEHTGVIVFVLDTKKAIERLMDRCAPLAESFTARFDIAALDSSTLVKYGCQYAYNQEFAIDELGRLALHTRIEDMQTSEHAVTVEEVREIVDEAIEHASRKNLRHFWDIIVRRRYDDEDMIILRERDFI